MLPAPIQARADELVGAVWTALPYITVGRAKAVAERVAMWWQDDFASSLAVAVSDASHDLGAASSEANRQCATDLCALKAALASASQLQAAE